jgi:hypothetical protein
VAWKAGDHGELILSGALANPVDGDVLLFKGDSPRQPWLGGSGSGWCGGVSRGEGIRLDSNDGCGRPETRPSCDSVDR